MSNIMVLELFRRFFCWLLCCFFTRISSFWLSFVPVDDITIGLCIDVELPPAVLVSLSRGSPW